MVKKIAPRIKAHMAITAKLSKTSLAAKLLKGLDKNFGTIKLKGDNKKKIAPEINIKTTAERGKDSKIFSGIFDSWLSSDTLQFH